MYKKLKLKPKTFPDFAAWSSGFAIRQLTECGVFLGLYVVLYLFFGFMMRAFWPQGGTINLTFLITIILLARWGVFRAAIISLSGVIIANLIMGFLFAAPSFWSFVLDYIAGNFLVFIVGYGAVFWISNGFFEYVAYLVIVSALQFVCSFFSGLLFFGAPANTVPVIYSAIYNGTAVGITFAGNLVILLATWKATVVYTAFFTRQRAL